MLGAPQATIINFVQQNNQIAGTKHNIFNQQILAEYHTTFTCDCETSINPDQTFCFGVPLADAKCLLRTAHVLPSQTCAVANCQQQRLQADINAMAGKRSNVWQHFRISDDNKKTECQLCKSSLAHSGSTSAIRNHMKLVYKRSNLHDSGPSMRQTSLVAWQKSRQALGKGKYERINKSLVMMCALDLRSISIFDGTGFQRFVHE